MILFKTNVLYDTIGVKNLTDEFDLGWEEWIFLREGQSPWQYRSLICRSRRSTVQLEKRERESRKGPGCISESFRIVRICLWRRESG